jgi:hypothetical protein
MDERIVSLPDDSGEGGDAQIRRLVEFWNLLRLSESTGATSWEELELLEHEVTDCLAKHPPDVKRADAVTAHAFWLIAGCSEF